MLANCLLSRPLAEFAVVRSRHSILFAFCLRPKAEDAWRRVMAGCCYCFSLEKVSELSSRGFLLSSVVPLVSGEKVRSSANLSIDEVSNNSSPLVCLGRAGPPSGCHIPKREVLAVVGHANEVDRRG
jgi:hypothetical protein